MWTALEFYLKYVLPHKDEIRRGVFRYASLDMLPEWDAVRGLQFENLIVNNFNEVIPHLGIGNSTYTRQLRLAELRGIPVNIGQCRT